MDEVGTVGRVLISDAPRNIADAVFIMKAH